MHHVSRLIFHINQLKRKEKQMSVKKALLIVLIAGGVILAVGIGPRITHSAHALPPAQETDPEGVTIPYPGRLDDKVGQPVADGVYDFAFALYEVETGGEPLWSEVQEDVAVQGGTFNVLLGSTSRISIEALTGGERWLAVGVRGPREMDFADLAPRQRLSAATSASPASPMAPSAGLTCPHDHWGETWGGTGVGLVMTNTVGNNVQIPSLFSSVFATSELVAGVWGASDSNIGVYGQSINGYGVFGQSTNAFGVIAEGADASAFDSDGDLLLEGTYGEIFAEGNYIDLFSNYDIRLHLDYDNDHADEWFRIYNGAGDTVFHVNQDGDIVAAGSKAGYVADVAQNDDTVSLETGDVVVISGAGPAVVGENPMIKVRLAAAEGTNAVIGVVDERFVPAAAHDAVSDSSASGPSSDGTTIAPGEYLTVVTIGSFKAIKVDASYEAIAPGDLLIASPNPGYAMRASSPEPGTIIGKALGVLESGTGVIPVMITLQ
jgi:hypothetical protein